MTTTTTGKRQAFTCSKCNKEIRKGQDVIVLQIGRYGGIDKPTNCRSFVPIFSPLWTHSRCSLGMGSAEIKSLLKPVRKEKA